MTALENAVNEPRLPFRMSRAPDLGTDGRRPIDRVLDQPFILGLFLPLQSGAWSPSTAPRASTCGVGWARRAG